MSSELVAKIVANASTKLPIDVEKIENTPCTTFKAKKGGRKESNKEEQKVLDDELFKWGIACKTAGEFKAKPMFGEMNKTMTKILKEIGTGSKKGGLLEIDTAKMIQILNETWRRFAELPLVFIKYKKRNKDNFSLYDMIVEMVQGIETGSPILTKLNTRKVFKCMCAMKEMTEGLNNTTKENMGDMIQKRISMAIAVIEACFMNSPVDYNPNIIQKIFSHFRHPNSMSHSPAYQKMLDMWSYGRQGIDFFSALGYRFEALCRGTRRVSQKCRIRYSELISHFFVSMKPCR